MKITYSTVRNPRWVSADKAQIHCLVQFDHIPSEVPFIADPNDCEAHGCEIFARCVAGDFGEIGMLPLEEKAEWPIVYHGDVPGWERAQDFLREANIENESKSDRGTVIVWGSALEEFSKRLLQTNGIQPHFTHSRNIATLKREGLVAEALAENLKLANDIRNEFAHQALTTYSSEGAHCEQTDALYQSVCGDGIQLPLKQLFALAASTMLMELLQAINAEAEVALT